uniref:Uncharacterized protein n=1 Tax=Triticum urartu TaxID=4572 RepID=A0A8R7TMZ0_TRIUA
MRLCVCSVLGSGEGRQGEAAQGQGPRQDAHQGAQHHHQEVPLWRRLVATSLPLCLIPFLFCLHAVHPISSW